jgi:Zn-finger nucleic acid-binding protein
MRSYERNQVHVDREGYGYGHRRKKSFLSELFD